jgi:hypothetical protein
MNGSPASNRAFLLADEHLSDPKKCLTARLTEDILDQMESARLLHRLPLRTRQLSLMLHWDRSQVEAGNNASTMSRESLLGINLFQS